MGRVAEALHGLAQGHGVERDNLVELLSSELGELRRCWSLNLDRSTDDVRRTLVGNLRGLIKRVEPRPARPKERVLTPEERKEQFETAILVCFNFPFIDDQFMQIRRLQLTRRRAWLAEDERGVYQIPISSCQEDFNYAVLKIEEMILAAGHEPTKNPSDPPTTTVELPRIFEPVVVGGQVLRADINNEFVAALESGARVIALVGHAGFGKSSLAMMLAKKHSSYEQVAALAVYNGKLHPNGLFGVLLRQGIIESENVVETMFGLQAQFAKHPKALFSLLANHTYAPEFIVLDCTKSKALPKALGNLSTTRSRFILLCLPGFKLPNYAHVIDVGPLADCEADALLGTISPTMSASDKQRLVPALHGYLPAVLYAANVHERHKVSVNTILLALRCRPDIFYARMPLPDGVTPQSMAQDILAAVESVDPLAGILLECMVFLERTPHVSEYFIRLYAESLPIKVELPKFSVSIALGNLMALQLIDEKEKKLRLKAPVRAILYQYLRPRLWQAAFGVLNVCRQNGQQLADMAEKGSRLTRHERREAAYAICHIFDVLDEALSMDTPPVSEVSKDDLEAMRSFYSKYRAMIENDLIEGVWIGSAESAMEITTTWAFAAEF